MFDGEVTLDRFRDMPPEYQEAVHNILTIHTVSELYGADVFYRCSTGRPTSCRTTGTSGSFTWGSRSTAR